MKKYAVKIEKLVKEKLKEKPKKKKEKELKGFMARKEKVEDTKEFSTDMADIVAQHIVAIRKKRMELKG
tara:strand:+ start:936 stop:1142 length:207 start_codon:yes stop_codon:yes gene_type:complete